MKKHYIQYHNADSLGRYPNNIVEFTTTFDSLQLNDSMKYSSWFWTKKKPLKVEGDQYCFLIVGKTERGVKKYVLWAYFKLDDYQVSEDGFYNIYGTGYNYHRPIILNQVNQFKEFIKFCGNFGLGFQNIDSSPFCKTLLSFTERKNITSLKQIETTNQSKEEILQKNNQINNETLIDLKTIEQKFTDDIEQSIKDNKSERQKRLKKAKKKPDTIIVSTKIFIRNPDVVAEVLYRAQGICEKCKENAPFKRDSNNADYLEVHHVIPLSENGDDAVENCIALCPNCHRKAHFGKKTY